MRSNTRLLIKLAVRALALASWATGVRAAGAPSEFTLRNGLRVRLVPVKGETRVAVLLGVRAGFMDEPPGLPHLAHVAEHLLVFGFPAGSDEAAAVTRWYEAGQANAETLAGWMYFDLYVAPGEFGRAVRVQADRLSRPDFTAATLRREVPRTLAELEHLEGSATGGTGKFAFIAFAQAVLHGRAEVPLKAATRAVTVEDIRRFHAHTFRPDRAMLLVVGDIETPRARQAVEEVFGAIAMPGATPEPPPGHREGGRRTVRWDVSTRHLMLAWRTAPASDPDHAALTPAADALAQRLALDRDVAALAKQTLVTNEVEGFFLVNAQANPHADLDALRDRLLDQVRRLSTEDGFGDGEVSSRRQQFAQEVHPGVLRLFALSVGSRPLLARTNLELRRMGKELAWGALDAYTKRVMVLDGGRVRGAVRRFLDPERASVVPVEPGQ